MMKKLTILYLILLLPALLFAGEGTRLTTLDNGLTLYTKEDHSRPLISLFSIVDGGSRTETPDIAGLSHFYEHLIARGGSKKQAETEYRRQMMLLGQSHIYTYDDGTAYGFTVPKENFDEALWRLADFMMDLIPDTAGIRKERTIVLEEYHMSYADNPQGRVYEQLLRTAFTRHPYYPTTIGLPEVIESADLEKLRTFYEERYVPNQIVMAVVGDFQTEKMIASIRHEFGKYPPGRISFELGEMEPEQTAFRQVADSMDVSSSYIMFGYHIPPTASPDMPAIKVMSHILGGASNSRLDKALKIDQNLVLYVHATPDFLRDPSLLYLSMQCAPENEEEVIRETLEAIRSLVSDGVTKEELTAAKEKLIADEILSNQTYRGQAENICRYAISESPSLAFQMANLLEAVTAQDVRRVAADYLNPSQATLSLIVPKGKPVRDYSTIVVEEKKDLGKLLWTPPEPQTLHAVLDNGLTVIVREDYASPTVCMTIFVRGGQWLEGEGKAGVAYLTADMLGRGTRDYSREQLLAIKEKLGINLWATAYEDYIQLEFNGLSKRLDDGLDILDQMLFYPTFSEENFKAAKADQLQAIEAVEDQPWEYTHREALADLYERSPYRNLVIGEAESVSKLSRKDVIHYYNEAFVPANMIVVAVGDVKASQLIKQVEALWGIKPKKKAPEIKLVQDEPSRTVSARHVFKQKDQNTFNISFLAVGVKDPDFLPMVLAKRILNTRLFFKYIYDKGMAYRMWTRLHPRMGQARFYFEMGVSDENFPVATKGILADLDTFLKNPISEEDLDIAKKDEITRNKMIYQTNEGVANALGYWETVGLGYKFFDEFPRKINKISAKQVEKAARKYLGVDRYQLVNVGTAEIE